MMSMSGSMTVSRIAPISAARMMIIAGSIKPTAAAAVCSASSAQRSLILRHAASNDPYPYAIISERE